MNLNLKLNKPHNKSIILILFIVLSACKPGSENKETVGPSVEAPSTEKSYESRKITVTIGEKSMIYTLADLKKMDKTTIADYEAIGGKKGRLGVNTWTGASLKELLLDVDPNLADSSNSARQIVLTSVDDWVAVIKWPEMFGDPRGGEVLYNIKGCNECHGINGEGTAPVNKRPTPVMVNRRYDLDSVVTILRTGGESHGMINPMPEEQVSKKELKEIMDWLENPQKPNTEDSYRVDPSKMVTILAYEKNGKAMTGEDGLIQLIVGIDEFSSRYSHWVSKIEVE